MTDSSGLLCIKNFTGKTCTAFKPIPKPAIVYQKKNFNDVLHDFTYSAFALHNGKAVTSTKCGTGQAGSL
jgi:hypothetical protein